MLLPVDILTLSRGGVGALFAGLFVLVPLVGLRGRRPLVRILAAILLAALAVGGACAVRYAAWTREVPLVANGKQTFESIRFGAGRAAETAELEEHWLELAELYPQPSSRSMSDLDFVVHSTDKERVHQIMTEKLGFQTLAKMDFEWIYQRESVKIEIHDHLIYYNPAMFRENKEYFERAWEHTHSLPDTVRRSLDWDFHMVYLILHLKKHFLQEGVGFRLFLDLAFVAESGLLHWDVLREQLEQARLLDFAETCFALCERWFDMKLPLTRPISDAFYREAVDTTLANGVYGGSGEEVKRNQVMTHMLLSGKGRAALEKLFPPYSVLRTRPGYTFVDGKPWLMPVLWIYRMGHALVVGDAAVQARRLKEMDNEDLAQRKAVLQEWNLLGDRNSNPASDSARSLPAPLLNEKDVLLMRCLFAGALSAESVGFPLYAVPVGPGP